MPSIATLLCQRFLVPPVGREIGELDYLDGKRIRHVIGNHDEIRQQRWIFDVDQLLKQTK